VGDEVFILTLVMFSLLVTAGVIVVVMGMYQGMRMQAMQHRERLAMIEKGLAPSPATDPDAFDRWRRPQRPRTAATTLGVVIVALGLALGLIIGSAAGEPDIGLGVGGAIAILGGAFIVIGELQRKAQSPMLPPHGYSGAPPIPPDRGNVGP
jgi:hypothetical protein